MWPLELGSGTLNPHFVVWPLELGLGTRNPRFVVWPLELVLGTRHPRFVVWPLELGLGTLNPPFVAWPLELGLGTLNPRFVVWPLELGLGTRNPPKPQPNPVEPPSTKRKYTAEECERENKKTQDEIPEYLLAVSWNLAHPLHPVYDDGKGGGVQWWVKRYKSTCVLTQFAQMGADAETLEEFWMKYGHPELLNRESLFRIFLRMKHTPPAKSGAFMSHTEAEGFSEVAWRQSVACVHEYLNHVVQEIRWADRLNPFNHCPHFPFFMNHFTDSMPIISISGIWSANLWNPSMRRIVTR